MRFGVKIKIIEYVDDSQPGWVRCVLTDAFGKEWYFTEKVPIMTASYLDETSQYPQDGIINCINTEQNTENGFVNIDTSKPYAIYSEDDQTNFTVKKNQILND
jgi:hypothetical protein